MTSMQRAAWIFAVLFMLVFVLTNIPAFNDAEGYNFGLFKIDPIDNVVHLLTALLGFAAAWVSSTWSRWYVVVFGSLYALDALVGMTTQLGLLDLSFFSELIANPGAVWNPDFTLHNFLVNVPHIGISAAMILSGTLLYRWVMNQTGFVELLMLWKIVDRAAW